jgi:cell division septum initiation protein DivIVA
MDPADPKQFLAEITRVLDQTGREETHRSLDDHPLRESLRAARVRAEELQGEIEAAQERAAVLRRELAGLITQAMLDAHGFASAFVKTAAATAEEVIAAAKAEGDQTIQSAQERARETLSDARKVADDTVAAAESRAAKITEAARADVDRTIQEARGRVAEIEQTAERRVAELIAKVEAFDPQQEQISQSLKMLANKYAVLVQQISGLQAEGQEKILPVLHDALQALRGEGGTQRHLTSTPVSQPSELIAPAAPEDRGTDRRDLESFPDGTREAAPPRNGEIILQQVSNEEAAAFVDALPRLPGVRAALLQTFYQMAEVATIDVLTEGPLNMLDFSLLSEFEIEVIGNSEDILTLHIKTRRPAHS